MPSAALLRWQADRLPRLTEIDAHCAATLAITPPPTLTDENLRGYVMLLSAHFQGSAATSTPSAFKSSLRRPVPPWK